jgi:hypothetical protein
VPLHVFSLGNVRRWRGSASIPHSVQCASGGLTLSATGAAVSVGFEITPEPNFRMSRSAQAAIARIPTITTAPITPSFVTLTIVGPTETSTALMSRTGTPSLSQQRCHSRGARQELCRPTQRVSGKWFVRSGRGSSRHPYPLVRGAIFDDYMGAALFPAALRLRRVHLFVRSQRPVAPKLLTAYGAGRHELIYRRSRAGIARLARLRIDASAAAFGARHFTALTGNPACSISACTIGITCASCCIA